MKPRRYPPVAAMTAAGQTGVVRDIFTTVHGRYDFLNHLLSLRRDVGWRAVAIGRMSFPRTRRFLDVATGTADLAIAAARRHPGVRVVDVDLQILPVPGLRHPVHPRRGLRANRPIGRPEPIRVNVVQQRGEPHILVSPCRLAHTLQRTGRTRSGSVSGMRFAGRVPLGRPPSLPHLRHHPHGVVRRVRRYYGAVRLPILVHLRRTTMCSLSGPAG